MTWRHYIYIASKQLQYECGDAAVDSYQYVHAGQNHIGCAGDLKEERGRVHQRGDGPSGKRWYRDGVRWDGVRKREGKRKEEPNKCSVGRNVPVEQQQQGQHRQIGGGDVGVLLETHKDDDDQCGWDDVVTLQERKRRRKKRRLQ